MKRTTTGRARCVSRTLRISPGDDAWLQATALRPNPDAAFPSLDTADELPGAIAAVILDEDG